MSRVKEAAALRAKAARHRVGDDILLAVDYYRNQARGTVVTANHHEIQMSDVSESTRAATIDSLMGQRNLGLDAESERRLHELLHALPAAVYTTDALGRITFYNEAAATLWGCRPVLGSDEWCGSWKLYWPDGTPLPHSECPALCRQQ
jgi:PAS domain-containing protein